MAPKTQKTPSEKKKAAPGVKKTAAPKKTAQPAAEKAASKAKKIARPHVAAVVTQGNLRTILAQIAPGYVFSGGSVSLTLTMVNRVVDTLIRLTFAARPLERPTLTRSDVRTALRSFLPIVETDADGEKDSFREHMNDTLDAYFANQARIKAKKATDKALRVAAAHDLVGAQQ